MKRPKIVKRHCPHCNKHAEHKVAESKNRGRSKANPLSRFATTRVRARGERRGAGNLGRYSKPPIKSWKMTGKKQSKKHDLRFTCQTCKKAHAQNGGKRAKKLELI